MLYYTQGIEQVLDHLILLFSNDNAFRALEGRSRAISSQFMPKLSLTETPAQPSNLPKLTPCAMIFWLSDDSKDVQYILDLFITITWTWFRLVGLNIVSVCLHPTFQA